MEEKKVETAGSEEMAQNFVEVIEVGKFVDKKVRWMVVAEKFGKNQKEELMRNDFSPGAHVVKT